MAKPNKGGARKGGDRGATKKKGTTKGRDADGKKVRWTDERKLRENVLFLSPKASKALITLQQRRDEQAANAEPEKSDYAKLVESDRQKRKKRKIAQKKKLRAKLQVVEEGTGDIHTPLNFDDSFDEEEEEIKEMQEKKKQEILEQQARGRRKVFVKGLPFTASMEDVQKHFEACGEVIAINYPQHEDGLNQGRPKGFAFVEFDNEEAVVKALMMDGKRYGNRELVISVVKEVESKGKGKGRGRKQRRSQGAGDGAEPGDDGGDDDDSEGAPSFDFECDSSPDEDEGRGNRRSKAGGKGGKKARAGGGAGGKKKGKKKGRKK